MKKSSNDNPMKDIHPYDVTAFYFANLKEEEMTDGGIQELEKKTIEAYKKYLKKQESKIQSLEKILEKAEKLIMYWEKSNMPIRVDSYMGNLRKAIAQYKKGKK